MLKREGIRTKEKKPRMEQRFKRYTHAMSAPAHGVFHAKRIFLKQQTIKQLLDKCYRRKRERERERERESKEKCRPRDNYASVKLQARS
jgi:hypothetical protein